MECFVIGGTGLVGNHVVKELLNSSKFTKVTSIGRRQVPVEGLPNTSKLVQKVVDFDNLDDCKLRVIIDKEAFEGHDCGFLCLGTTKADAGSAKDFYKIDHDYVLHAAKLFKEAKGPAEKHCLLLTAVGTDKNSWFLYPRTKGETEEDVKALGFTRFSIFRPGLLLMDPGDKRPRHRFGESVLIKMSHLFGNPKSMSVYASAVAKSMRIIAERKETGLIYENKALNDIASQ